MTHPSFTDTDTVAAQLWQQVNRLAHTAGLDPTKFNDNHHQIVAEIAAFLAEKTAVSPPPTAAPTRWFTRLFPTLQPVAEAVGEKTAVSPLIICGKPGTGKTTFLYLLDIALRHHIGLPDTIQPTMLKHGRQHPVYKRTFCGHSLSLLSVRKWSQLLHFYAWDVTQHRFNLADLTQFIQTTLLPMQIIFADEVEMVGYAPTIPDLARHGLLVVGTSNEYHFQQLIHELGDEPRLYTFRGSDMRQGTPTDAIVRPAERAWSLFGQLQQQPSNQYERLPYQLARHDETTLLRLDFVQAVNAPLLETEWIAFLQQAHQRVVGKGGARQLNSRYVLLFDDFSLGALQTNYNAIIRFVALLDAVEQLGVGLLVRNQADTPQLSRPALSRMKATIEQASGVDPDVKKKTAVGIDRTISRLGAAGQRARSWLATA